MYAADVKGSIAFSKALLKAGIVTAEEQKELERGLKLVEGEWASGEVCYQHLGNSFYREYCVEDPADVWV